MTDPFIDEPRYRIGAWLSAVLESHASANLLIMAVILIASLPLLGIGFFATRSVAPLSPATVEAARAPAEASLASGLSTVFRCEGGKAIIAVFSGDHVILSLSDGRQVALPEVRSGFGTGFANSDGSFVFWDAGAQAQITENGIVIYERCAARAG